MLAENPLQNFISKIIYIINSYIKLFIAVEKLEL